MIKKHCRSIFRAQPGWLVPSLFMLALFLQHAAHAADWPMWRYDAARSACASEQLPSELHLQWQRELPTPRPAWRDASNAKIQFDLSYEPIAVGNTLIVPSMVNDSITAYDTQTGAEKWRFYTDGPVRFAPVAHAAKVYCSSDDGYIYCLQAHDGTLLWKKLAGPEPRKLFGNGRLIGMWPVRGAPVILNDTLYCAAGVWPFMGTFIYAMDPEDGHIKWMNSGSGSTWTVQQHFAASFSGVAPQGYLAVNENVLLVSGGRTVPAAYDVTTGRLHYYRPSDRTFGKDPGGYGVSIVGKQFFNGTAAYSIENGRGLVRAGNEDNVYDKTILYRMDKEHLIAEDVTRLLEDKKGFQRSFDAKLDPHPDRLFLKAGHTLYGARTSGEIIALDVTHTNQVVASVVVTVEGTPGGMIAADSKLFVVTEEGSIYCFGEQTQKQPAVYALPRKKTLPSNGKWSSKVEEILQACGTTSGYCLVYGVASGGLVDELIRQSQMHIVVLEPDAEVRRLFRHDMTTAGLYGTRVAILDADTAELPPYFARLILSETREAIALDSSPASVGALFQRLRPYGGLACLPITSTELSTLTKTAELKGADQGTLASYASLRRVGAIPGTAAWTHQYADPGNSVVSHDKLVKAPLGVLWFGGPTNDEILPRHGHGPAPQVVGGRLLIEGQDLLRAMDVYTGQVLWEKQLKDIGWYYRHTGHHPGANEIGSNYVCVDDAVYVMMPDSCLVVDPATGDTLKEFSLPSLADGLRPNWGSIRVWQDYLVVTAAPISVTIQKEESKPPAEPAVAQADVTAEEQKPKALKDIKGVLLNDRYAPSSRKLIVMDRHTGKVLWSRDAVYNFRHNSIAAGNGLLFCIDGMSSPKLNFLWGHRFETNDNRVLYALDISTGEVRWKNNEDVFGTFLSYSAEYDALLQAGSRGRDRAFDESGRGMAVYRGSDGDLLWKQLDLDHSGPCLLHHRTILGNGTGGYGWDLLTGKPYQFNDPLTDKPIRWKFTRMYGCNTAIAGEHLMLFRSGAAGYFDLESNSGTGNMGGFKSGCTSNLIPADGLLNAPDYTRTCTCSYQNQTSLAMVHMPEMETWTFSPHEWSEQTPIVRMGINLGAPGDRTADNGTLWLDCPSEGSPSPDVPVTIDGTDTTYVQKHSLLMDPGVLPWVGASCVMGATNITATLSRQPREPCPYTVTLYFAELEDAKPGERVFGVELQGKVALESLDIAAEAGVNSTLIKKFTSVPVAETLSVALAQLDGTRPPTISGIEVVAE